MSLDGIYKVRVIGVEPATTEQLREVAAALAFAGITQELRVGLHGEEWTWRTPLLTGAQLEVFHQASGFVGLQARRSPTTATHADLLAKLGA